MNKYICRDGEISAHGWGSTPLEAYQDYLTGTPIPQSIEDCEFFLAKQVKVKVLVEVIK